MIRTSSVVNRLGYLAAVIAVAVVGFVAPSQGSAVGSYSNASIADVALRYVGQYGGAACVDAGRSGYTGGTPLGAGNNDDGECRAFVNCVVRLASGGTQWPAGGGGGYWSGFTGAGGIEVSESAAVKGDIIQWAASDAGAGNLHTTIVVANLGGGNFDVVDSNWVATHKVGRHTMNVHMAGWPAPRFFRMGTVGGGSFPDGSFVSTTDNGEVYRIVGGAPVYVSNWAAVGGPQAVVGVTRAQLNAMPAMPHDGTFVASAGFVYRIAGGAPVYVSSWDAVGGAKPVVEIDHAAIDNAGAGGAWNHLRKYPADGTFVAAKGFVYRIAGGAPIYVSSWDAVGGAKPVVEIDHAAIDRADGGVPWNHLRKYPADGTFVAAAGYVYRIAGGAPIYVSNWDSVGGAKAVVVIDHAAIDKADGGVPWNHLRKYPVDGTFVAAKGYVYRIAGGAPLYLSNWDAVGGAKSVVEIDHAAIDKADGAVPWNHLRVYPADGTLIRSGLTGAGYVVRGGVASLSGTTSGTVVDPRVITNAGGAVPWNHLRKPPVPAPAPAAPTVPPAPAVPVAPKPTSPGGTRTLVVHDRVAVYRLSGVPRGCLRPGQVFTVRASAVRRSASSGFRGVAYVDFFLNGRRVLRNRRAPYAMGVAVSKTPRPGAIVPVAAEVFVKTKKGTLKKGTIKKHPVRITLKVCG